MAWDGPTIVNLGDALADLYPTRGDSYRVVAAAELTKRLIRFDDSSAVNWYNILERAKHEGKLSAVIDFGLSENASNTFLQLAKQRGVIPAVKGPDIRKDVAWHGPSEEDQLEKLMGPTSLLMDVSFLEIGAVRARPIGLLRLASGGCGTGFLVVGDILVTNHHVLRDASAASGAELELNYQQTPEGLDAPVHRYRLAPKRFWATSEPDDWSAVAVDGEPVKAWGRLELAEIELVPGDRVNIIQHPGGGPKQVAFYHNTVTFVGHDRVQYLTDTLPGSSGSPVFDKRWRVVALHHSGGWMSEPGAAHKIHFYRNEGIHINAVLRGLRTAGWKG